MLDDLLAGALYTLLLEYVSGDAFVPSAHDVRIVFDAPNSSLRVQKTYLTGGGSDAGMTAVGNAVQCALDATTTGSMGAVPGPWRVFALVDNFALSPEYGATTLTVVTPPGGPV